MVRHCFVVFFLLLVVLQSNFIFANDFDPLAQGASSKKVELAVTAIFRDEARFLREWIEYYRLQGVDKFYLFDNLSQDNSKDVLLPYINRGIVELCEWHIESDDVGYWNHVQVTAYAQGMSRARADGAQWLIVIDVDEFIVPVSHSSIVDLVRAYNPTDVGMLSALWLMFGTSHLAEIPENQLMIEALLYNGGLASRIGEKSILHTQRADTDGPHYGICHSGYRAIRLPWESVQINHYWSRDERFFYEVKIPRRLKWNWSQEHSENFMNSFNKAEFIEFADPILRYVGPLKERMGVTSQ